MTLETRRTLLRLVERFPGLHLRELARAATMSEALAGYHLDALVDEDLVRSQTDGGFRRFYPRNVDGPNPREATVLALLRQRVPLQVAVYLLSHGPSTHQDLVQSLKLAKSTVSYHLGRLVDDGLLVQEADQKYALREPRTVERVILRWRPPADLTDRFQSLWSGFYREAKRK